VEEKRKTLAKNLSFFSMFLMIFSCCLFNKIDTCDAVTSDSSGEYIAAASVPSQVYVCGVPIGIKMKSDGVIVTGFLGFKNEADVYVNPSFDAGILVGDRIISAYGEEIHCTEDLKRSVEENHGQCNINVVRNDEVCTITMTPDVSAESHMNKLGLWVKDDAAGIGTLTYINPDNGGFGALGHGIGSVDMGGLFAMSDGVLYDAAIGGCVSGKVGQPGELQGYFLDADGRGVGTVEINSEKGVYGTVNDSVLSVLSDYGMLMPVASGDDVRTGSATVISTVSGTHPELYDIEIKSINSKSDNQGAKSMVIHITDKELLSKTGGIVQGMSGSPIIQDGKLVGAVTHVMVNDPTTGYGIFIENMLSTT